MRERESKRERERGKVDKDGECLIETKTEAMGDRQLEEKKYNKR